MSVVSSYLKDVQKGAYGADFFHKKIELMTAGGNSELLSDAERKLLQSYLE